MKLDRRGVVSFEVDVYVVFQDQIALRCKKRAGQIRRGILFKTDGAQKNESAVLRNVNGITVRSDRAGAGDKDGVVRARPCPFDIRQQDRLAPRILR